MNPHTNHKNKPILLPPISTIINDSDSKAHGSLPPPSYQHHTGYLQKSPITVLYSLPLSEGFQNNYIHNNLQNPPLIRRQSPLTNPIVQNTSPLTTATNSPLNTIAPPLEPKQRHSFPLIAPIHIKNIPTKKNNQDKIFAFISHSPQTFPLQEPFIDNAQLARRKRRRTTRHELSILQNEFELGPTPSRLRRQEIAAKVKMDEKAVQIWFQNKRQSLKRTKNKSDTKATAGEEENEDVLSSSTTSTPTKYPQGFDGLFTKPSISNDHKSSV